MSAAAEPSAQYISCKNKIMTTPVKIHRNQKFISLLIGKRGIITTWTIVRTASRKFNHQAPFPVVIAKLENGERVMGQLVDFADENLKSGQEVEVVLRRTGTEDKADVISYSIKFRPVI